MGLVALATVMFVSDISTSWPLWADRCTQPGDTRMDSQQRANSLREPVGGHFTSPLVRCKVVGTSRIITKTFQLTIQPQASVLDIARSLANIPAGSLVHHAECNDGILSIFFEEEFVDSATSSR